MRTIAGMLTLIFLAGCSLFTPPRENPLLNQQFNATSKMKASFGMAATDANRRVAIIDILNGHICVEPPPEAANTISEAFDALLKADVEDKGNIGASLSQSISQNISQLYRRTQTVQMYRDAVFALCQSAINGTILIDETTRATIPADLREKVSRQLSSLENPGIYKNEINEINKGLFGLRTLDALDIRSKELLKTDKAGAENLDEIHSALSNDLKRAEFRRRLEDGLKEAFDVLKIELPLFYETEKLRFIAEIGKPIPVCNKETTFETKQGDTEQKKLEKVTCEAKVPENLEKVISEYVKSLPPAR